MLKPRFAIFFIIFAISTVLGETNQSVSAAHFLSGECDNQKVSVEADVADVLRDETNPEYIFLVLNLDGETIYAPAQRSSIKGLIHRIFKLVGARVKVTGICDTFIPGSRQQMGRQLYIASADDIAILSPAPDDSFDVPELGDTRLMSPQEIARLGRHRISGKVLASWNSSEAILRAKDGRLFKASFTESSAPARGDCVEVVGRPTTDVYRINLEQAAWRITDSFEIPEEAAKRITVREIMTDESGRIHVKQEFTGRNIRIRGIVRNAITGISGSILYVEDGRFSVPVHFAANTNPEIEIGSIVDITGVCIPDIENWRPNAPFPQIKGFFVVAHGIDAIEIISTPPWWTAGRLLAVIGFLIAAITAAAAWNFSLRTLAERRGRALLRSQLTQMKASLKIGERTRLAAELHDSLAQTLTGVAMEIGAAKRLLPSDTPNDAVHHLEFAANAIDSSRDELRNCLWDLRGSALDEPDMEKAIVFSLKPHIGETALFIRFQVPRSRLSEALAHATLRIVRELVINAIRHGGAKAVRVAGCIDGNLLKMSISDNGCGFDTRKVPGIEQGHFGLQGIRERIDMFEGTFSIESALGQGTRAEVALVIESEKEEIIS